MNQIDYNEAVEIVYPLYVYQFEGNNSLVIPTSADPNAKTDYSSHYEKVIKNCSLFEPNYISQLVDTDLNKAISILESEKPYYTPQDLKTMQNICMKLDNLPNVGKMEKAKVGLFSKEEKEYFYCRHGHKNDSNVEFCNDCYENIKGFTKRQVELINKFKRRIDILEKLSKSNNRNFHYRTYR